MSLIDNTLLVVENSGFKICYRVFLTLFLNLPTGQKSKMAEFSSMRASVTGSAVPMHSYSYGSSENGDSGNVYVDLDAVNNVRQKMEQEAEGAGNTVTFGGVETFATNSAAGSTIGAVTEGKFLPPNYY